MEDTTTTPQGPQNERGEPQTLFDAPAGTRKRDEAIQRVDQHANPDWKDLAWRAVIDLAMARSSLTSDDVWELLHQRHPDASTHERRALGAVMKRAAGAGAIIPTERHVPSRRPDSHRRPIRVWQSNLRVQ